MTALAEVRQQVWDIYQPWLRPVAGSVAAGAALGLLIGGVGGRLAMHLLFLTSDPRVRGVASDDGFIIGQVTLATLFLLLVGVLFGVPGAFAYLAVRPILLGPEWARRATCGVLAALVMSPLLIHPHSIDFTVLSPRWLSVALFVAIPGLFGFFIRPAVESATRPDGWYQNAPPWLALPPLALVLIPGPPLFLVGIPVAVFIAAHHVTTSSARLLRTVRHPVTMWTVRTLLVVVATVAMFHLAQKAAAIL